MADESFLIAGLGNPGAEYDGTRHNIGFELLDRLADTWSGSAGVRWDEKFGGMLFQTRAEGHRVMLFKPMQYMNVSGPPLQECVRFFKVAVEDLIVVHDDIDLPFGTLRIKQGGGDGGHNGIRSIAKSLGTKDFLRFKLGVGRPEEIEGHVRSTSSWVLGKFSDREQGGLDAFLARVESAVSCFFSDGVKAAQTKFNG